MWFKDVPKEKGWDEPRQLCKQVPKEKTISKMVCQDVLKEKCWDESRQ